MMMKLFSQLTIILSVTLWNSYPISAQNITNHKIESCNCNDVTVSALVDPVSSTYTFTWVVSINGGNTIDLILVGLDGNGRVSAINQSMVYSYAVINDPSVLSPNNAPFNSSLTFMFSEDATENLVFSTVSFPLVIRIPRPVVAPLCNDTFNYQGTSLKVVCSDNSNDCFCSKNNIPGYVTVNGRNITVFCSSNDEDSCLVKPEFNFCPSRCPATEQDQVVTCSDGSQDCFSCGSNISGTITCPCGENLIAFCGEDSRFNFSTCYNDQLDEAEFKELPTPYGPGSWTKWFNIAPCSVSCGNGTQKQRRICNTCLENNNCGGDREQFRLEHCCNDTECPAWSMWTKCSISSNSGTRSRTRECNSDEATCVDRVETETQECTDCQNETNLLGNSHCCPYVSPYACQKMRKNCMRACCEVERNITCTNN